MTIFSSRQAQSTPGRRALVALAVTLGGCAVGVDAPPRPGTPAAEAAAALPQVIAASEAAAQLAAEAEGVAARLRAGELTEAEAQAELKGLTAAAEAELVRARAALEAAKAPLRRSDHAAGPGRP